VLILLVLLALLVAAAAFGGLATFLWRAKRAPPYRAASIAIALVALLCATGAVVGLAGVYRLAVPRREPAAPQARAPVPVDLARGEHLAYVCARCHSASDDLPLSGGQRNFLASTDRYLGELYAPNLTPAGPIATWSDTEVVRAIREGVDNAGRSLLAHPPSDYNVMSDGDATALVGFLCFQPAVVSDTSHRNINLLGTLLIGSGQYRVEAQPPVAGSISSAPSGATPERGRYLVAISGCRDCHGPDLKGTPLQFPPDLIQIAGNWTAEQFVQTLRTGKNPLGGGVGPQMPWQDFARAYTDEDLEAIYRYLRSFS
jgi:mono/diheme cytochrome c family protein